MNKETRIFILGLIYFFGGAKLLSISIDQIKTDDSIGWINLTLGCLVAFFGFRNINKTT